MKISSIKARQIIDSRGDPTVEAEVVLEGGNKGRAAVPSGASTGKYEAVELRDHIQSEYLGDTVLNAVKAVNDIIEEALVGKDYEQAELDKVMLELDQTENKSKLGANAILAVSLAFAWAKASSTNRQLFQYIGELYQNSNFIMPRPMFNIMNGAKHGNWVTDIQEYMIIPIKPNTWAENLEIGSEIFHTLEAILKEKGLSVNVGNEGGFAPQVESNNQAMDLISQAVEKAGYKLGEDIKLAFDIAASEFFQKENQKYELKRDNLVLSSDEMLDWVLDISKQYPVASFEDPFDQDDWEFWSKITDKIGNEIQIVGDDFLVTNTTRVAEAIKKKACNALLVKVNQIGTLTEALNAMKMSEQAGWKNIVSHRSGETEDVTIAHIAVGTGCGQIKGGSLSRGERTAKYNELLRIEESLINN